MSYFKDAYKRFLGPDFTKFYPPCPPESLSPHNSDQEGDPFSLFAGGLTLVGLTLYVLAYSSELAAYHQTTCS